MHIPDPQPLQSAAEPDPPDWREALRLARENGRHACMTMWSFRGFAVVLLTGSLQLRHGWPVQIADFAYAAYLAALWLWIYRRR